MTIEKSLPNMVMVCVDGVENGDIYGRYFHRYKKEETFFPDSATLVIEMERFYDAIGYPSKRAHGCHFQRSGFDTAPRKAGNISCRCNFQTECKLAGRCGLDGAENPEAFLQRYGTGRICG